jgi:hypothetical protein
MEPHFFIAVRSAWAKLRSALEFRLARLEPACGQGFLLELSLLVTVKFLLVSGEM